MGVLLLFLCVFLAQNCQKKEISSILVKKYSFSSILKILCKIFKRLQGRELSLTQNFVCPEIGLPRQHRKNAIHVHLHGQPSTGQGSRLAKSLITTLAVTYMPLLRKSL